MWEETNKSQLEEEWVLWGGLPLRALAKEVRIPTISNALPSAQPCVGSPGTSPLSQRSSPREGYRNPLKGTVTLLVRVSASQSGAGKWGDQEGWWWSNLICLNFSVCSNLCVYHSQQRVNTRLIVCRWRKRKNGKRRAGDKWFRHGKLQAFFSSIALYLQYITSVHKV